MYFFVITLVHLHFILYFTCAIACSINVNINARVSAELCCRRCKEIEKKPGEVSMRQVRKMHGQATVPLSQAAPGSPPSLHRCQHYFQTVIIMTHSWLARKTTRGINADLSSRPNFDPFYFEYEVCSEYNRTFIFF